MQCWPSPKHHVRTHCEIERLEGAGVATGNGTLMLQVGKGAVFRWIPV